jgi:hypothetical protein
VRRSAPTSAHPEHAPQPAGALRSGTSSSTRPGRRGRIPSSHRSRQASLGGRRHLDPAEAIQRIPRPRSGRQASLDRAQAPRPGRADEHASRGRAAAGRRASTGRRHLDPAEPTSTRPVAAQRPAGELRPGAERRDRIPRQGSGRQARPRPGVSETRPAAGERLDPKARHRDRPRPIASVSGGRSHCDPSITPTFHCPPTGAELQSTAPVSHGRIPVTVNSLAPIPAFAGTSFPIHWRYWCSEFPYYASGIYCTALALARVAEHWRNAAQTAEKAPGSGSQIVRFSVTNCGRLPSEMRAKRERIAIFSVQRRPISIGWRVPPRPR